MKRLLTSLAASSLLALSVLCGSRVAHGQAETEEPPQPAPPPDDKAQKALERLENEMRTLRAEHEKMKVELADLKRKQAEAPTVLPPPRDLEPSPPPLVPTASVALRYDNIFPPDPTEQFQGDPYIDGFRMRVRAGVRLFDDTSLVNGEVRLSLGLPENPAIGYVSLGEGFRVATVGLDRYWAGFRPFDDKSFIQLTVGKMPQPFWRGDRGHWKSELTWDVDVNPTGVALDIKLFEQGGVVVDNTAAYFVMHDIEDLRFQGLTGPVSLIADQLRVRWTYLTAAFAFYDYENLNTGMSTPGALTSGGVSTQPASNAFLLRDGFQSTNNRISYGAGAEGFVEEAFRVINPSLQGRIPLPLDTLGKGTELFMFVDYSHNLAVARDRHGIGGTAGLKTGDHQTGWLSPLELWFTYRLVEADATLATFADSNLGGGTDFRGFEIGTRYDATRSVSLTASYFDYLGAPDLTAEWRRFFVDVRWDY